MLPEPRTARRPRALKGNGTRPRAAAEAGRRSGTVQALERGLRILDVLSHEGRQPLAQIAKRVALNLSTAHHLMKTLESLGYVALGDDKCWQLSGRVFQLAAAAWNADELAALGLPALAELGRRTGESTQLAVFDRRHVILVGKFDGAGPERLFERLGAPRPAYCTALGKALLAYQDAATLDAYLAATELKALTPTTITSASRLREELRKVRRAGYAIDEQEFSHGIRCVAAPVFNFTNRVVAALGMFGPAWRLSPERLAAHAKTVTRCAQRLTKELGYAGAYPPPPETP
ncbi:MAG TPA: IclR family transcriptional regulator [Burkholderiales bacterium]